MGGVLAQVSQSLGIPTLKLRAWGEQLTIWPFNSHILFGGPDYHGVSLTTVLDEEELRCAQRNLIARIEGDYASLSYMSDVKKSEKVQLNSVENSKVFVMYLHDFLDSPGVYGETVFHDQWDWIRLALKEVSKIGGHLLLKLHSNQNPNTKVPNELLVEHFRNKPNVTFLDRNASLKQIWLVHSPKAVLTMYGSVIMECACLKIPVIYTSHNPYVAFGFGFRATSKRTFASAIKMYGDAPLKQLDEELIGMQVRLVADAQLRVDKLMNESSLGAIPFIDLSESKMKEFGFILRDGSNIYDRIALCNKRTNWGKEHHLVYEYVKEKIAVSPEYHALMAKFK